LLLSGAAWHFKVERDAFALIAECLTGLLPISFVQRKKAMGYWVSIWILFLISLTGLVAEGELPEYGLFLLHLGVLIFNLNAANLFFLGGTSMAQRHRLPEGYFKQFSSALFAGLLVGGGVYLFFPRQIAWQNPFGLNHQKKTTGFTGTVALDGAKEVI